MCISPPLPHKKKSARLVGTKLGMVPNRGALSIAASSGVCETARAIITELDGDVSVSWILLIKVYSLLVIEMCMGFSWFDLCSAVNQAHLLDHFSKISSSGLLQLFLIFTNQHPSISIFSIVFQYIRIKQLFHKIAADINKTSCQILMWRKLVN